MLWLLKIKLIVKLSSHFPHVACFSQLWMPTLSLLAKLLPKGGVNGNVQWGISVLGEFLSSKMDDTMGTGTVFRCRSDTNIFENLCFHFWSKMAHFRSKIAIFGLFSLLKTTGTIKRNRSGWYYGYWHSFMLPFR